MPTLIGGRSRQSFVQLGDDYVRGDDRPTVIAKIRGGAQLCWLSESNSLKVSVKLTPKEVAEAFEGHEKARDAAEVMESNPWLHVAAHTLTMLSPFDQAEMPALAGVPGTLTVHGEPGWIVIAGSAMVDHAETIMREVFGADPVRAPVSVPSPIDFFALIDNPV